MFKGFGFGGGIVAHLAISSVLVSGTSYEATLNCMCDKPPTRLNWHRTGLGLGGECS